MGCKESNQTNKVLFSESDVSAVASISTNQKLEVFSVLPRDSRSMENQGFSHPFEPRARWFMCRSRGGIGGLDPPEKSQKYRVS